MSQILKLLRQHKLFGNHKRCDFGKRKVANLGHIISSKGMAANPSKIKAMVDWPMLRNIKELRGFLGLTGYYLKFVAGYAHIAHPLIEQLKKDKFN